MASTVNDLLKTAATAAQNQQAARTAAQSMAAQLAAQRGATPRPGPATPATTQEAAGGPR